MQTDNRVRVLATGDPRLDWAAGLEGIVIDQWHINEKGCPPVPMCRVLLLDGPAVGMMQTVDLLQMEVEAL